MKKYILLLFTSIIFFSLNNTFGQNSNQNTAAVQSLTAAKTEYDYGSNDVNTFKLLQNYPNPFNPTTTIQYKIPADSHVTLKIFNSLGNQIKTLVDGYKTGGTHEVVFNAENLSSGVYYAQLRADKFTKVIRMVLLK